MTLLEALSTRSSCSTPATPHFTLSLVISGHDQPCPGPCATGDPARRHLQPLQGLADAMVAGWHGTYALCLCGHLDINIHSLLSLLHQFTPLPASLLSFFLLPSLLSTFKPPSILPPIPSFMSSAVPHIFDISDSQTSMLLCLLQYRMHTDNTKILREKKGGEM